MFTYELLCCIDVSFQHPLTAMQTAVKLVDLRYRCNHHRTISAHIQLNCRQNSEGQKDSNELHATFQNRIYVNIPTADLTDGSTNENNTRLHATCLTEQKFCILQRDLEKNILHFTLNQSINQSINQEFLKWPK